MCFVYVLGSTGAGGYRTYVGWTTDLDRRLTQHNTGTGARSTRGRQWALLYAERLETRPLAMSREWYLKQNRAFRRQLAQDCGDSQSGPSVVGCAPRAPDSAKRTPGSPPKPRQTQKSGSKTALQGSATDREQEALMAAQKKTTKSSTKIRANRRKAKNAAKERRRRARSEGK
jgi:putative endonuclease